MTSATTHEDIITGGGSDDFCLARHLVLTGGEDAIGASLAATLERNHGIGPHLSADPTITRARRRWGRLFYPELDARARGIAAHRGGRQRRRRLRHRNAALPVSCRTGVLRYLDLARARAGGPLISRNFDFTTETLSELHSAAHNREHLIWADQPPVVTNHLLHRYTTLGDLPAEPGNGLNLERARRVAAAIAQPGALDAEELERRHTCVQIDQPETPVRTLWHAVYDPTTLTVQLDVYRGESANGPRRSKYTTFRLARELGNERKVHG